MRAEHCKLLLLLFPFSNRSIVWGNLTMLLGSDQTLGDSVIQPSEDLAFQLTTDSKSVPLLFISNGSFT